MVKNISLLSFPKIPQKFLKYFFRHLSGCSEFRRKFLYNYLKNFYFLTIRNLSFLFVNYSNNGTVRMPGIKPSQYFLENSPSFSKIKWETQWWGWQAHTRNHFRVMDNLGVKMKLGARKIGSSLILTIESHSVTPKIAIDGVLFKSEKVHKMVQKIPYYRSCFIANF